MQKPYPQYLLSAYVRHLIDERFDYSTNRLVQVYDDWRCLLNEGHNLLTNAGKDKYHNANFIDPTTGANWIALTESTITPAATDVSLTGEITTNGLNRQQASTRTHTAGANTSSLSRTFTASGSFTSVLAAALMDAAGPPVAGIMAHIATFATGSGTLVSGDQLAVTGTMTLS